MAEPGDRKGVSNEEERKRLVNEISKIKDVLDSFKYGLNFEEFADSLFKTIDRQTIAIKQLDGKMNKILERMELLESRFDEGVEVTVSGMTGGGSEVESKTVEIVGAASAEKEKEEVEPSDVPREKIVAQIDELKIKIGRLYEKENEYEEMAMNDPAGAEDYQERARVAREMRITLEDQMRNMEKMLD
ncbi:hypothetical protein EU546_04110 [Candidatus Thorarchaeota archaeon]|nr:MAG: hypothetical protein EU546_04110 [Candidatus Thorarchaeota archaeon]